MKILIKRRILRLAKTFAQLGRIEFFINFLFYNVRPPVLSTLFKAMIFAVLTILDGPENRKEPENNKYKVKFQHKNVQI
jgi:hypothetical protein